MMTFAGLVGTAFVSILRHDGRDPAPDEPALIAHEHGLGYRPTFHRLHRLLGY